MTQQTKSNISIEEKLRSLYDLQFIDSRLDELRNLRGELPAEVEDLENEIEGLQKRIDRLLEERESISNDIELKKELIKNSESLIRKYKKQQDNVRNNREFEALAKEVEFQELEIELSNKRINEYTLKIENKDEIINQNQEKLESLNYHLKHKKEELDKLIKETEKEESFLLKKSEEFSKVLDERLLKSYHRIRKNSKNGLAVVSIERGSAAGSFFTIPPQVLMEISLRKKIISDEHSGKILVDEELAKEEKEKMYKLLKK